MLRAATETWTWVGRLSGSKMLRIGWGAVSSWRVTSPAAVLCPLAVVLSGCVGTHAKTPLKPVSVAERERASVQRETATFMRLFKEGRFSAQWAQLSPIAKAAWPSRSARTQMLARKFGDISIRGISLGKPASGAAWTSQESPRISVAHTWRVPVAVNFRTPDLVRPSGVASSYAGLDLYLSVRNPHARPLVVGEGPASLDAPVITPAGPANVATGVPILMYHLVGPYPSRAQWTDDYGYQIEYGLTASPSQFAGEIQYLAANGYHAISLTRLSDALLYGLPLPTRPIALTFDDGRESPWQFAVPVLRRFGFTASFFVCSGFVDETNQTAGHLNVQTYLTWNQVADLARTGFWIEDHGQKDINVLWDLSLSGLRKEVQDSAHALEARTHQLVQFVAYTGAMWPYPQASQSDPQESTLFSRLAGFGYVGGVVDARVPSLQESTGQIWQLPRVRVVPEESLAEFVAGLAS
jgi:peptidoglycan/xylan/chitin deacetylase (PgdA/CDA1 family)